MSQQSTIPSIGNRWCSYYCEGNPVEHLVTFVLNDEEYTQELCDYCLEEFLEYGPKAG